MALTFPHQDNLGTLVWDSPTLSLTDDQTLFISLIQSQFPLDILSLPCATKDAGLGQGEGSSRAGVQGPVRGGEPGQLPSLSQFLNWPISSLFGACFALCNPLAMIK